MPRLQRSVVARVASAIVTAVVVAMCCCPAAAEEEPFGLQERTAWTTSRVVGTPDPPLPYTVEQVFKDIDWQMPIYALAEPGTDDLFIIEQGGGAEPPSRILRVRDEAAVSETETLLEIEQRLVYAVTFHPQYELNGLIYVFSNGPTGDEANRFNRVARYTVSREESTCDPASEHVIIDWRSAGHDGGDLAFGHDGMLYIASGDGTSDSDTWVTGQDISDLLGGVLRIDVDHVEDGQTYSIPPDNPFVELAGARGELWAYGLRNPWRMSVDRKTGHLWVGNNGQDLWETAHLVRRGDNLGWSVYEGNHPFYLNRTLGPTPFVPPTIEHHHREARSLTGGVVYYGHLLPELEGAYTYGDYSTGKIWGARHDGNTLVWHRELADTSLQIAGFALSHRHQLLVIDHGSGFYRLVAAEHGEPAPEFPRRLIETGLFASTADHIVAPGVIPYSINAASWLDGAHAERYLAVPGDGQIDYVATGSWNAPDGTVLMQTISLDASSAVSGALRIETRLLVKQQGEWAGYSYRWNEQQTDGDLVDAAGAEIELTVPPGDTPQRWQIPSRAECMACHSRAANFVLGLTAAQLHRTHDYGGTPDNQLRTFAHIDLFSDELPHPSDEIAPLVDPHDATIELESRVRAYLHVNCSACHTAAGGGNSRMELRLSTQREAMNLIEARPQHATFGIDNAMLVAPGDAERSVLYQRLSRRGRGQMPPLGSHKIDERAVALVREWIETLEPSRQFVRDWRAQDIAISPSELASGRSTERGEQLYRELGCIECHRLRGEGGGAGPELTESAPKLSLAELIEAIVEPSRKIAPEYASTLLVTSDGRRLEGRIERETEQLLVLRTNAAFAQPVAVQKSDIEERAPSQLSIMPRGMLNTLVRDEILDLLAYIHGDGAPDSTASE